MKLIAIDLESYLKIGPNNIKIWFWKTKMFQINSTNDWKHAFLGTLDFETLFLYVTKIKQFQDLLHFAKTCWEFVLLIFVTISTFSKVDYFLLYLWFWARKSSDGLFFSNKNAVTRL